MVKEFTNPLKEPIDDDINLFDFLDRRAQRDPDGSAVEYKADGGWKSFSATQFRDLVIALGKGLIGLGVKKGDAVSIVSRTRWEWTALDMAIMAVGALTVPVYETNSDAQVSWIFNDSQATIAFAEDDGQRDKIESIHDEVQSLRKVFVIEAGALEALQAYGKEVSDEEFWARKNDAHGDDLATIVYTSGSTGTQQTQNGHVSSDIMDTSGTEFRVAGIVDTGGSEDSIIYALAGDVDKLTGSTRGVDVIEYSSGASDLTALVNSINDMTSMHVKAQQVTKITASDTRVITMLQTLFWIVSLVVLVFTLVGVGTTISSIVSQRRNEIGLRKALGASSHAIGVEFYVESAVYGLLGGLLGTATGYGMARWLCATVFERSIGFNWWLAVVSVVFSALVAVVASIPPVHRATRIDPAVVLREE